MDNQRKYRPSNGSEGCWFIEKYCYNCIHGKYEHTGNTEDKPCEISTLSFMLDIDDKDYPEEWQYDDQGKPCCTAFRKWDWGRDDDGNWIDPPPVYPDDPNQLCFPFILEEIGVKNIETLNEIYEPSNSHL
jgi:hypothetical protein